MAPIKQEEQLKEKLEQRELQPSDQAWSQLANRLDAQDKKERKSLWWLGIAASIVLIIAVSFPYFNNDAESMQPTLVDVKNETDTDIKSDNLHKESIQEAVKETTADAIVVTKAPTITKEQNVQISAPETVVKKTIIENQDVVDVVMPQKTTEKEMIKPVDQLKTFEEVKVLDVVAEIQKMQQEPAGVSDREIDSLLKVAHKEILNQRIFNETTKTVDADALLQDVEADLEQSFRSKVFEALKSNYGKVKTAVAERNN